MTGADLVAGALTAVVVYILYLIAEYIRGQKEAKRREIQMAYDPDYASTAARLQVTRELGYLASAKEYNKRYAEVYNQELERRNAHYRIHGKIW